MRIFGCLSWFDENPRWLAATVASMAKICDHVVAVDGAFFYYPEGRPASAGEQAATIQDTARACGMGCTVHVPQGVWMGNEVEKRNAYARLVNALSSSTDDWMLSLDADEEITYVSPLTRQDLAETEHDAATIGFWTTDELRSWFGPTRRLYRALPNLAYTSSHFTVEGDREDGRVFLGGRGVEWGEPEVDAEDLTTQIRVEHKHHLREAARAERADVFAARRVSENLEPWVRV